MQKGAGAGRDFGRGGTELHTKRVCNFGIRWLRRILPQRRPGGPPLRRGLTGRCPRCGEGALFTGFLKVAPRCGHCGQDFSAADSADGPACFVMSFAGFVVVAAALVVEIVFQPPYWLHALLWIPLILVMTILPLRPVKGLLIALQFHHKAAEGRLVGGDRP